MNKQIKTLMGQALDKAVPYTWHNLDHAEVEKVMQEFAELIVRECAKFANQYIDERCDRSWLVGPNMQKYFGVKE